MKFTKKDLKTGMTVKFKDSPQRIVMLNTTDGDRLAIFDNESLTDYFSLDYYNDNMEEVGGAIVIGDIISVYNQYSTLLWERKEIEELTMEELCKELGREVKIKK